MYLMKNPVSLSSVGDQKDTRFSLPKDRPSKQEFHIVVETGIDICLFKILLLLSCHS